MSAPEPNPRSLRDRLLDLMDGDGEVRRSMQAIQTLIAAPGRRSGRAQQRKLVDQVAEYERVIDVAVRSIERFAALGWAMSSQITVPAYEQALTVLDNGDQDEAELIIAESWDDAMKLRRMVHQLSRLGSPRSDLNALCTIRAELLFKAVDHHLAGAFEASVAIVLAQCEGLVADVTDGKLFFSRNTQRMADVVSAATIASVDEALPVVREVLSRGMNATAASGELRRHGILHGRELGYHTRVNSLKGFALLQALVEWAGQTLAEGEQLRSAEVEARWTGSDEVDERGRRRDRREFNRTCSALRYLAVAHMGWYSPSRGYDRRVLTIVSNIGPLRGFADITASTSDDGRSWWAWRQTITGWVFGIAGIDGPPSELFFDGPTPPTGGPVDNSVKWTERAGLNWSSR